MKQAQNAQKRRGRPMSRNNGKSNNSNRNEPKVRGNPKQLAEKYKNQARESLQAGDRMQAEYYFQYADHYHRVANEMRGPNHQNSGNQNANGHNGNDQNADEQRDGGNESNGQQQRRRGNNRRNHRNRDGNEASSQPQDVSQENEISDNNPANGAVSEEKAKPAPRRRKAPVNTEAAGESATAQPQPNEVHPELNLGDEASEKPARRRAPVRRKRSETAEADAAAVESKPSSSGDEAA